MCVRMYVCTPSHVFTYVHAHVHMCTCVFVCEEREVDFEQFLLVKSIG